MLHHAARQAQRLIAFTTIGQGQRLVEQGCRLGGCRRILEFAGARARFLHTAAALIVITDIGGLERVINPAGGGCRLQRAA